MDNLFFLITKILSKQVESHKWHFTLFSLTVKAFSLFLRLAFKKTKQKPKLKKLFVKNFNIYWLL